MDNSFGHWLGQLADREPQRRAEAATALGDQGADAQPAVSALIKLLTDPDASVRNAAKQALAQIGNSETALQNVGSTDKALKKVVMGGLTSVGCLLQLIFGLLSLAALIGRIYLDLNKH